LACLLLTLWKTAIPARKRGNLDLRTEYLGLARPEPELFMLADDFRALLEERGLLPVALVARERALQAALDRLDAGTANVVVEADGGLGKTRLAYEMSQGDRRDRRWFFVPEGLAFQPSRLSDLESGDEIVVVIDDAHRRPDLRALLAGLERRVPRPQPSRRHPRAGVRWPRNHCNPMTTCRQQTCNAWWAILGSNQ